MRGAQVDMYLQFREQNWDQVDLTPYNKVRLHGPNHKHDIVLHLLPASPIWVA